VIVHVLGGAGGDEMQNVIRRIGRVHDHAAFFVRAEETPRGRPFLKGTILQQFDSRRARGIVATDFVSRAEVGDARGFLCNGA